MNQLHFEELFEHIPGAMIIDLEGVVIYLNNQCATYLCIDREVSMGKHIKEVFPDSKMLESIDIVKPKIVFYHSFGIGISVHVPIFVQGKKTAILEFDVIQASELLYELADNYTRFLDNELNHLQKEIDDLRGTKYTISNIIGESEEVHLLKECIINAAKYNSTVIIYGETGTGKELVAHSIHNLSRRANYKFVKINAAGLPESLVESELFGYEGGTFTGAMSKGKKGKFELADKGTLYIDEVNQMPLNIQPKLLRVLQENEIEKIGGEESIPVDVRVIVTTNQELRSLVKSGQFREDLFYRLNVIQINVPPLRDRKGDIPTLTNYFVRHYSFHMGKNITHIDERIYTAFEDYEWPGNIRELQNTIERGIHVAEDSCLTLENMGLHYEQIKHRDEGEQEPVTPIEKAKRDAEIQVILEALKGAKGNKSKAAEFLGIARPLLYQKIERLNIKF